MAASVECRLEEMRCGEITRKENGDDLSLFVDFSGEALNIDLLQKSNQFRETLGDSLSESESPLMPETKSMIHGQDSVADDLLNSENNTTDYDWLLSPPRNPVHSLEVEEQTTLANHSLISNGQSTSPESSLENPPAVCTLKTNITPKLPVSTNVTKSSCSTIRRPSPARKPPSTGSRSSTPTTKLLRSSTPTSRATKPESSSKRSITPAKNSARSSTPTPRPAILPATSKSKSTSRSSTPTTRPSIFPTSKSTSRSSTPTARPSNPPSCLLTTSVNGNRPSSARGTSASIKSRPSKNPPEIKKSVMERSSSASKVRPGLPAVKLPMNETNSKAVPKRTSCSPSRGPVSNGIANNINLKPGSTRSRGYINGNDDVNPVLMGTKMVERVVNMRKLAPPKQDHITNHSNTCGKLSVSQDNPGFGRTLSKKSFDMALRHLDIRRSMPGNMRAMVTKVPASYVYSVRPESAKSQTISASDSPLATSSSASSDP